MTKRPCLLLNLLLLAFAAPAAFGQTRPAPAFEVASVKPIAPGGRPTKGWAGMQIHPDSIEFAFQSLSDLLCYAYGYNSLRFDGQITGLPDWADKQRFDVVAKIGEADLPAFQKLSSTQQDEQRQAMMQALLADRFHLTLHRGSKQVSVYELVVAKPSSKLKDAATDPDTPPAQRGDKSNHGIKWSEKTSDWQADSMEFLANFLSIPAASVGRPVIDKTGLTGTYNFTLDWSIYSARAAASDNPGDAATIFTALGEIGLKLQPAQAPMPTIVIDHVEQPTED